MSHRFVRCPHCKMPHDAAESVCPNTGIRLSPEARPVARRADAVRSRMSEIPPPERRPEPLAFDPQTDRSKAAPESQPATRDGGRELIGQTVGGRYRIKGLLGEGGMGTVYDAEHLGLNRQVAIKVLSPLQAKRHVAVKRFQQEARAAGAIGHPNICEVYDLGLLDDGSPYLVMEKLVGQTLAERIAKEGGLPFEDVIEVVSQVLSGLVAAHEKGIIHRDIKPENIFLARRVGCPPIIKLLDFGVSKMMAEFQTSDDALDLTRTGMVMGTPYYMSPEQARGERNLDGRVDVYACGVVMYEAIAGRRPFLAPNYNALLLAIINTTPQPLSELRPTTPPELEAIISRAMARNRDERTPAAKHFLRELTPPASDRNTRAAPTAEERKRAPVLGGRGMRAAVLPHDEPTRIEEASPPSWNTNPGGRTRREPLDRPDGPSATLRSHLGDPPREPQSEPPQDRATRMEARPKLIPSPFDSLGRTRAPRLSTSRVPEGDDSFDIPIRFAPEAADRPVDDDATEVFHPAEHLRPRADPRVQRPTAPRGEQHAPPPVALPITLADDSDDDVEGETIVQRPDMPPARASGANKAVERPGSRPPPTALPFNPEETVKLEDAKDLERLLHHRPAPPRRR